MLRYQTASQRASGGAEAYSIQEFVVVAGRVIATEARTTVSRLHATQIPTIVRASAGRRNSNVFLKLKAIRRRGRPRRSRRSSRSSRDTRSPGNERPAARVGDQEPAVDLGRLRAQPALEQVLDLLAGPLDDRLDGRGRAAPGACRRAIGCWSESRKSLRRSFSSAGTGSPERLGARARLRRVGEGADVVELGRADELAELLELRLALPGKPDDERRADRDRRARAPASARSSRR